jgi:hypothetical protein
LIRRFATIARVAATSTFALVAVQAQAANLIRDGGFETPPLGDQGFVLYETGQSLGAWTVEGEGNVAVVNTTYKEGPFAFPAKSGKQWLDLTGLRSNRGTGVVQVVDTVPFQIHVLRFSVGNVDDERPIPVFGQVSKVEVRINDQRMKIAINSDANVEQLGWRSFTLRFTPTLTRTKISFHNRDLSNDNCNGLDAVSLTSEVN